MQTLNTLSPLLWVFLQQFVSWDGHQKGGGGGRKGPCILRQILCFKPAFQNTTKCRVLGQVCTEWLHSLNFSLPFDVRRVISLAWTSQPASLKDCLTMTSQVTVPLQWGVHELDRPSDKYLKLLQCHWDSFLHMSPRFPVSESFHKHVVWDWRDSLTVKSVYSSFKRTWVYFRTPRPGHTQPPLTLPPGHLMPPSGLSSHCTHLGYIHTYK